MFIARYGLAQGSSWDLVGPHYNRAAPYLVAYKQMTDSTHSYMQETEQEGDDGDNEILILSCGSGLLEKFYREKYGYLPKITAVDHSIKMIKMHERNNPEGDIARYHLDSKDFMDKQIAAGKKYRRIIINNGIIEHPNNIPAYLSKVRQLLAPGGSYHISIVLKYGPLMLIQSQANQEAGYSIKKFWNAGKFFWKNRKMFWNVIMFIFWVSIVTVLDLQENEIFITMPEWQAHLESADLKPNMKIQPYGGEDIYMSSGKPLGCLYVGKVD